MGRASGGTATAACSCADAGAEPALRGVDEIAACTADDQLVAVGTGRATRRARRSGTARSGSDRRAPHLLPSWRHTSAWRRDTVGSSSRMSAARLRPIRVHSSVTGSTETLLAVAEREVLAAAGDAVTNIVEPRDVVVVQVARVGFGDVEHRRARELGARRNAGTPDLVEHAAARHGSRTLAPERSRSRERAGDVRVQPPSSVACQRASVQAQLKRWANVRLPQNL